MLKSNRILRLSSTELIVLPSVKQSYSIVAGWLDRVSSVGHHVKIVGFLWYLK